MMKKIMIIKWVMYVLISIIMISITPSCKSKKCPDFTNVDGKVKVNRHGLVKKKRFSAPRSTPNF